MKRSTTTHKTPAKKQGDGGKAKGTDRQSPEETGPQGQKDRTPANGGRTGKGEPMRHDEEVQQSNDEHIDQDFPGYPHHPSRKAQGRTIHNGSAGAFDATEHSHDEDDEDQDSDDFAMDR